MEAELEFWTTLRFKITNSKVFDAYCDWIEPKINYLSSTSFIFEGEIGFLTPKMEVFKFRLEIPKQYKNSTEIDWNLLMTMDLDTDNIGFDDNLLELLLKTKIV